MLVCCQPLFLGKDQDGKKDSKPFKRHMTTLNINKYHLQKGCMKDFLAQIQHAKETEMNGEEKYANRRSKESEASAEKATNKMIESEVVAGTDIDSLYFDHDFGFFSIIKNQFTNLNG